MGDELKEPGDVGRLQEALDDLQPGPDRRMRAVGRVKRHGGVAEAVL